MSLGDLGCSKASMTHTMNVNSGNNVCMWVWVKLFPAICKIILYDRTSMYEVTILNLYAVNIHSVYREPDRRRRL